MRELTFVVPVRTVSTLNTREHWAKRAKRAKQERTTAWSCFVHARCRIDRPCPWARDSRGKFIVSLTRHGVRLLDDDNLRCALKSVRDGIADALGVDDRSPLVEWRYDQQRARMPSVSVKVERTDEKA
jgi:hypothetical protein